MLLVGNKLDLLPLGGSCRALPTAAFARLVETRVLVCSRPPDLIFSLLASVHDPAHSHAGVGLNRLTAWLKKQAALAGLVRQSPYIACDQCVRIRASYLL